MLSQRETDLQSARQALVPVAFPDLPPDMKSLRSSQIFTLSMQGVRIDLGEVNRPSRWHPLRRSLLSAMAALARPSPRWPSR